MQVLDIHMRQLRIHESRVFSFLIIIDNRQLKKETDGTPVVRDSEINIPLGMIISMFLFRKNRFFNVTRLMNSNHIIVQ